MSIGKQDAAFTATATCNAHPIDARDPSLAKNPSAESDPLARDLTAGRPWRMH